jgi:serine/threonine protein kinase
MGNNNIKLIDFGFAVISDKKQNIFCGTPSYMSPEMVGKVSVLNNSW